MFYNAFMAGNNNLNRGLNNASERSSLSCFTLLKATCKTTWNTNVLSRCDELDLWKKFSCYKIKILTL